MPGPNVSIRNTRLSKLGVSFPFLAAPMVGISHVAFRELVRGYTPREIRPLIFTEMLSTRRIPSERLDTAESLFVSESESDFVPQLLGNEERFIEPSLKKLMSLSPWGVDINMGCPVKKTLQHNWGVRLLGDKKYASEVVRMTKAHSPRPVSVKLRAGVGTTIDEDYLADFTDELEKAGVDWITVHCRASGMKHRGPARWDAVGKLQSRRSVPVVGNGDIQTRMEARNAFEEHSVDGVMIARGLTARPWMFWQIAFDLGLVTERPPSTPEEEGAEYFLAVGKLIFLLRKAFGDTPGALQRIKFYVGISHRWLPFGHHFWSKIHACQNLDQAELIVEAYRKENPQPLVSRVAL